MPRTATKRRHHADSGMKPERYRKLIAKLGLSQRAAGRFLGISDVQTSRMATGTAAIPPPVALLLEIMVAHGIEPVEALKLIGVNVTRALRTARAEQVNKAPRFYVPAAPDT